MNDIEDLQFILRVLGGKWKLHILTTLYYGKKRFKELEREIIGISPKMLIKELKDLLEQMKDWAAKFKNKADQKSSH